MRTKEDKFINIQNLDSTQLLSCVFYQHHLGRRKVAGKKRKERGRKRARKGGRQREKCGRQGGRSYRGHIVKGRDKRKLLVLG